LIKEKTCPSNVFALLWLAIQYEMNILISGGTASGKTSMLNVLMPFIPPNQRILSIEDTREIQLAEHLYWCPLITRQPNAEGKGEVTMLDLLVNALRMRPDRIILGEMRKKDQAEVLFEAMHTGHSVYATVHADTINETIKRLTNPPIEVPPNLLTAVNLNIVMFRDRRKGIRRAFQVGEFVPVEENGQTTVKPNILYRWKPEKDEVVVHNDSVRVFEELSRHTDMTMKELNADLKSKQEILEWMCKHSYRTIHQVGKIMDAYYRNNEFLMKFVEKDSDAGELFK
jgi:flagellar protein FlaI